jgi:hypothetical protein
MLISVEIFFEILKIKLNVLILFISVGFNCNVGKAQIKNLNKK